MSLITYQEIWNLLNEYQFDIDNLLHSDLVCVICSKIIKNAYQNICGCKFCLQCIEQYLCGEEKCCPGKIDDCKQIINFQRDVTIDNATNRKISQIKVKCPESFCQYTAELSIMRSHLKSHLIQCPYSDIGCNQPKVDENKLSDHLNSETAFHTNLLLNSIQNLKNEIDILHENGNRKEKLIEDLKTENLQLKHEVELLKTEDIEQNRTDIYLINNKLKENESLVNNLLEKIVDSENERFRLDNRIKKIENNKKKSIFEENIEIHNEDCSRSESSVRVGYLDSDIPFSPSFEQYIDEYTEIQSNGGYCDSDILDTMDIAIRPSSRTFAPFEWVINDFAEIQNRRALSGPEQPIFSESFYSHMNGYKLRLCIYPNGVGWDWDKYVTVKFGIIEGEFDHLLAWPMRLTITLALINQDSGEIFVRESYRYDRINQKSVFHKPVHGDDNDLYLYGTNKFININALKNNRKLLRNQSILIKCLIE